MNLIEKLSDDAKKVEPEIIRLMLPFETYAENNFNSGFQDTVENIMDYMKIFAPLVENFAQHIGEFPDFSLEGELEKHLAGDTHTRLPFGVVDNKYPLYRVFVVDCVESRIQEEILTFGKDIALVDGYIDNHGNGPNYLALSDPRETISEKWTKLTHELALGFSWITQNMENHSYSMYKFNYVASRLRELSEIDRACRLDTQGELGIFEVFPLIPYKLDVEGINEHRNKSYTVHPELK